MGKEVTVSSINMQILQAKITSRESAVKNLDKVLEREHSSRRLLRDQLTEHEVQMAERVQLGTDNIRWTTWAEGRLAGMQLQLGETDKRIEQILGVIVGHEAAINDFRSQLEGSTAQPVYVAVSNPAVPVKGRGFDNMVFSDLDRKGPSKKPHRKYVPKGERKKSAEPKPAKKDKSTKAKKAKNRGRQAA